MPSGGPELPPGWAEYEDDDGQKYYYDKTERKTTWTHPATEGAQSAAARAEGVLGVEILLADGGIAKGASGRPFAMAVLESLEQSVAAVTASVAGHEMFQKLNRLADADPYHVGLVEARLH